ncbi:MAG: serpin family protein [Polyangiaceae bacterium]|nr:serpin family protein [Polyangiaceae bacterium]
MLTARTLSSLAPAALALVALAAGVACSKETEEPPPNTGTTIAEARSDLPRELAPTVAPADYAALHAGNVAFAFDLYGELASADANFFCSPASVSVALAMTWAGAKGTTESEMAQALGFTLPQASLHAAFDKLLLELDTRNVATHTTDEGPKNVRLSFTNAAWAQTGYPFTPSYLDTLAVNYGAGVKLLDFLTDAAGATVTINDWVAAQTENKITDLIPPGLLSPLTRLVLTNTLYFYGSWKRAFDADFTTDDAFHAPAGDVTVPTLHGELDTPYAEGDGWQLASLPYDGDALVMTIVVPAAGRFDEIRTAIDPAGLAAADAAAVEHPTTVSVPKFRFTWGTESLKPALQALGMVDAFDSAAADFTGMEPTGELFVGDVLHKAFVGVDESGTEAAAATAVAVLGGGVPDRDLTADRPFVFLIRDLATGTILFVGQVVDPTAT